MTPMGFSASYTWVLVLNHHLLPPSDCLFFLPLFSQPHDLFFLVLIHYCSLDSRGWRGITCTKKLGSVRAWTVSSHDRSSTSRLILSKRLKKQLKNKERDAF